MVNYIPEPVIGMSLVPQNSMHGTRMNDVVETQWRLTVHTPGNELRRYDLTNEQLRVLQNQINGAMRSRRDTCGPECGHQRNVVEVCAICEVVVEDEPNYLRVPVGVDKPVYLERSGLASLETTIGTVMPGPDFHEENGDS